jgi:hypothetical protein
LERSAGRITAIDVIDETIVTSNWVAYA